MGLKMYSVIDFSLHKGNLRPRFKKMVLDEKPYWSLTWTAVNNVFLGPFRYFFRGGLDENSNSPWVSKNHNHSSMIVLFRFIICLKRKIGRNYFMVSSQKKYFLLKFSHNNIFFSNHFFWSSSRCKRKLH